MNHYPFHVGDYIKATAHLSDAEDLCYRRLLDLYYDIEQPIPLDTHWVSRRLRMDTQMVSGVLAEYFKETEIGWRNERCEIEIAKYHVKATANKANGKLGGRPKKTHSVSSGNPTETESNLNQNQNQNQVIDSLVAGKPTTEICPQKEILKIYAEVLPELPQPRIWEGVREKNLTARWRWVISDLKAKSKPHDRDAGLGFFRRMFAYIHDSDFLMGRRDSWSADLGWIVKAENFAKIIQGNYENKEKAA